MGSELLQMVELQAAGQQDLIEFLFLDLDLCITFTELAELELDLGAMEAADRVRAKAEVGYATVGRFMEDIKDPVQRSLIGEKRTELRLRLDNFLSRRAPGIPRARLHNDGLEPRRLRADLFLCDRTVKPSA